MKPSSPAKEGKGPARWSAQLPSMAAGRAAAAGAVGRTWLEGLDASIAHLERAWKIRVTDALDGGSHAFIGCAQGDGGEAFILKIEIPDNPAGEFLRGVRTLERAAGRGYCRLFAFDEPRRAALLERLGEPLSRSGFPAKKQMEIICAALKESWKLPVSEMETGRPGESYDWFRKYIPGAHAALGRPCDGGVVDVARRFLDELEARTDPAGYVLVHGDAHNNNMLRAPGLDQYKFIDPDGRCFERSYDLGVLMREWPGEYAGAPVEAGRRRCEFLGRMTGVDAWDIWQWGYLQMVATGLILLEIGQAALGGEMLGIAGAWSSANAPERLFAGPEREANL